ncbi:MAG: two pore domain potassium channel family protein [Actinobacteria bacterium]|nr:two pore domain potassium channel family protein [Actinomycetota bacterium]
MPAAACLTLTVAFVRVVVGVLGIGVVVGTFRDLVSTVITTQRDRRWSAARRYFKVTWAWYSSAARRIDDPKQRERFLVPYGPVSLVGLLSVWVALLVFGWGLIWWGLQQHMEGIDDLPSAVYFSGVTFLTIGYGDIVAEGGGSRILAVIEGLMGILTTALVIGLLPTLFAAYMRRESKLLTLDDLQTQVTPLGYLRRYTDGGDLAPLYAEFRSWDDWCADVYDSHTAYPMLLWFRSRQMGRSWSVGLGIVVESASYVLAAVDQPNHHEAQSLYRRAIMVLDAVRGHEHVTLPEPPVVSPEAVERQFRAVYDTLVGYGLPVRPFEDALAREHALRADYVPVLWGLSEALLAPLEFRPNVRPIPVEFGPSPAPGGGS